MPIATPTALDRARSKAYLRLLPLLFLCYVIAYVDRANVALAKLRMTHDLPGFGNAVIGFGAGVFFIGYFLLEIPGTLLVEKWSAEMDQPDHDHLGADGGVDRGGEDTAPFLRRPV